jgi:diguanylate cyclase (GGDEF)-like protein
MVKTFKKKKKSQRLWLKFLLSIGLTIVAFTIGILIVMLTRSEDLMNSEIKIRAKSHIQHVMKTRLWNAHYGGVYVEKKKGIISNPYLDKPDIATVDGKVLTLKNPALMTREISELFETDGLLTFHMTSLKPINPDNIPDAFEERALILFESGEEELAQKETVDNAIYYRYMSPLVVKESCLKCHAKQGYKAGDIRGGISVRFDITDIERSLRISKYTILSLGLLSSVSLLGIIYSLTVVLMNKLEGAQKKIRELVMTDELTKLYNRRYLFGKLRDEVKRSKRFKQRMSCMLIDIDFFKNVNDKHGHLAGDMILENVSGVIKECCREIDTVARYGGEEFIVLLPGTDLKGALRVAERIRLTVESLKNVYDQDAVIPVTVSVGLASYSHDDLKTFSDNDQIIKYVDEALYKAKENGRNRVEVVENPGR